jgi:hypothetical protein
VSESHNNLITPGKAGVRQMRAVINSSEMSVVFYGLDYSKVKSRVGQLACQHRWNTYRILPIDDTALVDFLDYQDYEEFTTVLYEAEFPIVLADEDVGF